LNKVGDGGKNMDIKMLLLYFVIGGVIVSSVTYLGSQAKSQLAAFIAFLPSISVVTLCSIYLASGTAEAVAYAKSMLILVPPWVLYIVGVIFLLPRIGLAGSLVVSIVVYLGVAFLIMRLT
jgi:uncharacterized membrane protein (GlpM family)